MDKSKSTVVPMHNTQTYGRLEEQLHSCLISSVYGDDWYKWSNSIRRWLYSRGNITRKLLNIWMGPRAGLKAAPVGS